MLSKLLHGDEPNARRKDALRRLGVTEQQLLECGDISSLLKMGKDGLPGALLAMRFSGDPTVATFLKKFDETPERDRRAVPWEAIALAAQVEPSHLLGSAILSIQQYSANAVKIIAMTHHPEITQKRVEFAKQQGGGADRTAIDTSLGFLPTARGSNITINAGFGDRGTAPKAVDAEVVQPELPTDPNDQLHHLFPSLSETQDRLVPTAARLLEGGR